MSFNYWNCLFIGVVSFAQRPLEQELIREFYLPHIQPLPSNIFPAFDAVDELPRGLFKACYRYRQSTSQLRQLPQLIAPTKSKQTQQSIQQLSPLLNASTSSASLAYNQLYNPSLCQRKTNERPQHRRIVIQIQCITFAMLNVGMSHGETLARSMTTAICNRANMSRAKNYALADVQ